MPLDVDAWLSSVPIMRLSPAEEGAYARLLFIAWATADCTLPDDDAELAVLSRLGPTWSRSAEKLRALFIGGAPGRLKNERQQRDFLRIMTGAKPGRKKNGAPTRAIEGKARGQFVVVSDEDHAKLIAQHGEAKISHAYGILDNYFGADERRLAKYTSHYRCILSWVLTCEKMLQRFPLPPPKPDGPAAATCPKCKGPLSGGACGKCGIDYSPRRR